MSEKLCKICGKIPTNHPNGTCAMCRVDGKLPAPSPFENNKAVITAVSNRETKRKGGSMAVPIERQCKTEGCEKYAVTKGLCIKCYREKKGISPRKKKEVLPHCIVAECTNPIKSKGLCNKHYLRKLTVEGRVGKKTKKKSQVSSSAPGLKRGIIGQEGKAAEPENITKDNGAHIALDLSAFPKIHRYCTALDFVSPADMLGVILRKRLNELEDRIAL